VRRQASLADGGRSSVEPGAACVSVAHHATFGRGEEQVVRWTVADVRAELINEESGDRHPPHLVTLRRAPDQAHTVYLDDCGRNCKPPLVQVNDANVKGGDCLRSGDAAGITPVINPNNPTGAVYPSKTLEDIAELARQHSLTVLSDEIYDKILYDDAQHIPFALVAPDLFTLTFNGLSKAYRLAGFRAGWLMAAGPKKHASSYLEGLTILANMRLCANVPAQHAIQVALGGRQSIRDLVLPGGRLLEQRDAAVTALRKIPGVSCVEPKGALYVFPRLDPEAYPIADDQDFVLEFLREQRVLLVQGTGFNWPNPDHLRIVTLPHSDELTEAIGRLGEFLEGYEPGRHG
jgi:aspartate/methionine/tyrosine aminotransferase